MKLFKLTKTIVPEWGQSTVELEVYMIADDLEKIKVYIKDAYSIWLDDNLCVEHWDEYERSSCVYKLTEKEVVSL